MRAVRLRGRGDRCAGVGRRDFRGRQSEYRGCGRGGLPGGRQGQSPRRPGFRRAERAHPVPRRRGRAGDPCGGADRGRGGRRGLQPERRGERTAERRLPLPFVRKQHRPGVPGGGPELHHGQRGRLFHHPLGAVFDPAPVPPAPDHGRKRREVPGFRNALVERGVHGRSADRRGHRAEFSEGHGRRVLRSEAVHGSLRRVRFPVRRGPGGEVDRGPSV